MDERIGIEESLLSCCADTAQSNHSNDTMSAISDADTMYLDSQMKCVSFILLKHKTHFKLSDNIMYLEM